jgi:hypothetical protein
MHALGQQPISLGERADHQFGCAGFPRRQRDQTCLTNAWAAIPSLNPNQPAGVSSGAQKPTRRFSEGRISSVELSSTASSRRGCHVERSGHRHTSHAVPGFRNRPRPPIATSSPHQPAPGSTHSNVNRPLTHRAHSQKKHHEDNPKPPLRRGVGHSVEEKAYEQHLDSTGRCCGHPRDGGRHLDQVDAATRTSQCPNTWFKATEPSPWLRSPFAVPRPRV